MRKLERPDRITLEEYRKTHSVKATAEYFNIALSTMESILKEYGIYGQHYLYRSKAPTLLTKEQHETIVGNLLGDGWLTRLKGLNSNSNFGIEQKLSKSNYVKYLHKIYEGFSKRYSEGSVTDKRSNTITYYAKTNTIHHPIFTDLRHKWYVDPFFESPKIIPKDIKLTWRTIAIWACDDGNNYSEKREFKFHTECFSLIDAEFLLNCFKTFNINGRVYTRKNKPLLYFYGDAAEEIKRRIRVFVPWDCFNHKLLPNKPRIK